MIELNDVIPNLKRISSGYYAGACPFGCSSDEDGFQVKIGRGGRDNLWVCRGVTSSGNECSPGRKYQGELNFFMRMNNLSYRDAVISISHKVTPVYDKDTYVRDEDWEDRVTELCDIAEDRLSDAMSYLGGRGITLNTARSFRLGFVDKGMDNGFFIKHASVTIPWVKNGKITGVKLRNINAVDKKDRYSCIPGGRNYIYAMDSLIYSNSDTVFITEGEFDCILLSQEAREIPVVTLGSNITCIPSSLMKYFDKFKKIVCIHDNDEASIRSSNILKKTSSKIITTSTTIGKDITEAYLLGDNLKLWNEFRMYA